MKQEKRKAGSFQSSQISLKSRLFPLKTKDAPAKETNWISHEWWN